MDKFDYFSRDCHHLGIKNSFDHKYVTPVFVVSQKKEDSEVGIVNLSLQLPCFNSDFSVIALRKRSVVFNLFHSVMENSCHFQPVG